MEPVTYCSWFFELCATEGEWLGFWGGAGSAVLAFLGAIAFERRLRTHKAGKTRRAIKGQLVAMVEALEPFVVDPRSLHPDKQVKADAPEQVAVWNAMAAARAIVRWGVGFPDHLTARQWSEIENLRSIIDCWDSDIEGQVSNLRNAGEVTSPNKPYNFRLQAIDQTQKVLDCL